MFVSRSTRRPLAAGWHHFDPIRGLRPDRGGEGLGQTAPSVKPEVPVYDASLVTRLVAEAREKGDAERAARRCLPRRSSPVFRATRWDSRGV